MSALDQWAARSIARGSKSFALASRLFDSETRRRVRLLYAWCRHCDDVVDEQEGGRGRAGAEPSEGDQSALARLAELRAGTEAALAGRRPVHPAFAAIAEIAALTGMPRELPMQHLIGFAMDAHARRYRTLEDVLDYCHHVAGVVGRMMAVVMGAAPDNERLLVRAADLGLAFQLTNICRDVKEDAAAARNYLPAEWLAAENIPPGEFMRPEHRAGLIAVTNRMLALADGYYESAAEGATHLPFRSAWAVLTAAKVYRAIGVKVRAAGPAAWDERRHTGRREKLIAMLAARRAAAAPAIGLGHRAPLWKHGDTPPWREPAPLMAAAE